MLTKEQVALYQEHGYLLVERLLSAREAQELRQECHALAERLSVHANLDATWGSARKLGAQAQQSSVMHCHNVQFYSAAFSRLIVDERLTRAAADLMGSPNVQLHHTKMFIKPPEKGSPFPLHLTVYHTFGVKR
jgi:phytanoyl-CoA hydroxylase